MRKFGKDILVIISKQFFFLNKFKIFWISRKVYELKY